MTFLKPTKLQRTMLQLVIPIAKYLIVGFILMVAVAATQLALPSLIGGFIDESLLQRTFEDISETALMLFLLAVTYSVLNGLRFYLFDVAGNKMVIRLRRNLFNNLIRQEVGFFDGQKIGELSSRLSSDVESVRGILTTQLAIAARSLLTLAGGVGMMLYLSWQLTGVLVIVLPLAYVLTKLIGKLVHSNSSRLQADRARSLDIAQESFVNIRQIKSFGRTASFTSRYRDTTGQLLETNLQQSRIFAFFSSSSSLLGYSKIIVILWSGGHMVLNGYMTVGALTSFALYSILTSSSLNGVLQFWTGWKAATGASERIFELMERKPETKRIANVSFWEQRVTNTSPASHEISGQVSLQNVDFYYPQRPSEIALKNINLHVEAGSKIALVGASGAGKSTIAALLLGLYEPDTGTLSFDNVEYQNFDRETLNADIALVEQEPYLFTGTIAENIALGSREESCSREDVVDAAKRANAHQFIEQFENGYDTQVGTNGVQLSGGQKQRIAIARAVLRNPNLLILDEATSALDAESERVVQKAMDNLMEGRTTIIIAHRLSSIVNADSIYVLKQGQIIQSGNHTELMRESNSYYAKLVENQLQSNAA